jgi:hypothetical protein
MATPRAGFLRVAGEGDEAGVAAEVRAAFPAAWLAPWLRAQRKLDGAGYGASVVRGWERASPACARHVGPEPAIDLADGVSAVTIKAGRPAGEALSAAAVGVAARLKDGPRFRNWVSLMQRFAALAPESAPLVLDRMDMLLSRLTVSALEAWLLAGVRLGGGDRERRRAFFALETPDAERLLDVEAGEATFFDRERRMRAFLRALYGVAPPIRETPPGRHDGAGRRASFGGGVVRMPPSYPGFRGAQGEAIQRAALAHVGAHLKFSGARFPIGKLKPLQIAVVSLIEDARVEALAMREMPGLLRLWLPFHVAQASGALAAPSLFARLSRALIDPDFEDIDGWVRKGRDLFHAARDRWDDPGVSRAIGNLLGNDLGQMRVQFNGKTYVVEPPYRDDNLGLWEFDETEPPDPNSAETVVESVRLSQAEETPPQQEREDEASDRPSERAAPARAAESEAAVPVARLPEWDYQARRERPDWTTILDAPPRPGPERWLDDLLDRRADVAARLAALIGAARVGRADRLKRQADGETLDLEACIAAAADLRSGITPDPRVYQTTARRRRDLSVSVLLDASQSTADPAPGGARVIDVERDAVALLARAMDGLGDPFEVTAFHSNGREEVRVTTVKTFDEPFGRAQAGRLAGVEPKLSTRLGAALRRAGAGLRGRASHRRLVLVVTDGEPSDMDCPDPAYLVEDARHAVHGLAAEGIDCFCVAVGGGAVDRAVLDRVFGRRGHVTIARVEALPETLPLLYMRLTR